MKQLYINLILLLAVFHSLKAQFTPVPDPLGSRQAAGTRIINSMVWTPDSGLLVATNWHDGSNRNTAPPKGLYAYVNGKWSTVKIDGRNNAFEEYYNLSVAPDGKLFAMNTEAITPGSWRRLLAFAVSEDFRFRPAYAEFPSVGVFSHIAFDSDSNLWCSIEAGRMDGNGGNITLCKYDGRNRIIYTTKNCFEMTHFVFSKANRLIANNGQGYLREFVETTDANSQKVITDGMKFGSKCVVSTEDGSLWYEPAYEPEIIQLGNGVKTKHKLPVEIGNLNCMYADSRSNLYLGTSNGLLVLSKGQWKTYAAGSSGLPGNNITAITGGPNGSIWLAGNQKEWGSSIENIGTFVCSFAAGL